MARWVERWLRFCKWLWRMLAHWFWAGNQHSFCWGRRTHSPRFRFRAHPKPAWVKAEIIRLKALMPGAGCRTIAHSFNRRFAASKDMTVGKTYVADTIRRHQYAILAARRRLKHAVPSPIPRNLIWAMDLTAKTDTQGRTHLLLGIIDHASRACLRLLALTDKSSVALLHCLTDTIKQCGPPTYLRTDNEPIFTSRWFRLGLWALGIRHQRTEPGCPWQNGRVERFFGTVKRTLDQLEVQQAEELEAVLRQVRFFYNHLRPHQHLQGRTPAEVWAGIDVFSRQPQAAVWVNAWEGALQAYYADSA